MSEVPPKPDEQVGGTHYSSLAIEPIQFIETNNLGYHEGNVVKYISRWRNKNGLEDLKKAKWYIERLIEVQSTVEEKCQPLVYSKGNEVGAPPSMFCEPKGEFERMAMDCCKYFNQRDVIAYITYKDDGGVEGVSAYAYGADDTPIQLYYEEIEHHAEAYRKGEEV
mgnify:CR=1 FL=1